MKYLLPCPCGQAVEIELGQAGQTVTCTCGKSLAVPTMMQIKELPLAPEKIEPAHKTAHIPYRSALLLARICAGCLALAIILWYIERDGLFILFRGLACAFFFSSIALVIRDLLKSPLAADTVQRRTFFVLGIALLFPVFVLASYMLEWKPEPRHATLKRKMFTFGSEKRLLPQDSTPIPREEYVILWMSDEDIDEMMPMDLHYYFLTLESPTFSHNFEENYSAVKDTYRIWWTGIIIVGVLAFSSIIASFFMPRQTVVVTGWSGSEW